MKPGISSIFWAALSGLLFGLGLAISRMVDPEKVLGFLDIAGNWDPSLALVLAGATGTTLLGMQMMKRTLPDFRAVLAALPSTGIDKRLIGGALLFGLGWGLVGFCPGPALAALSLGETSAFIFVGAMLGGMWLAGKTGAA